MSNFARVLWWRDLSPSAFTSRHALPGRVTPFPPAGVGFLETVPDSTQLQFYDAGFSAGDLVAFDYSTTEFPYAANVRRALAVPSFRFGKVTSWKYQEYDEQLARLVTKALKSVGLQ